jgi:3-deoxy-7-phosphoheptulonate synthase
MIIVMQSGATEDQITLVRAKLTQCGFDVHESGGPGKTLIVAVGGKNVDGRDFESLNGVGRVLQISSPYKLASRLLNPEGTRVRVKNVEIGGAEIILMAGPCAVENQAQVETIAWHVAQSGAKILRGGAFKPRTSPYSFQGLCEQGLKFLQRAAEQNGLLVVSEVMDASHIPMFLRYVDILQVGARNMQNFTLLKELGRVNKPVLLKRGPAASIEEFLLSAEYVLSGGNKQVILCERGIKTFETYMRNTLDISAIPALKQLSHLPVIADPSHGTGKRDSIVPMARAAIAAGADGLLIEAHHDPDSALCDGAQSLPPSQLFGLMKQLKTIASSIGRTIAQPVESATSAD